MIFRYTITIALTLAVTTASAAMMRTTGLSVAAEELADDMAHYAGLAKACAASDGSNLNRNYWEPKIRAVVPQNEYRLFARIVRLRSNQTFQQMAGPDAPLKCDDALDRVQKRYPSIFEAGEAAEPICWSDVTDTNRCEGTGEDDILAGLPALLDGY